MNWGCAAVVFLLLTVGFLAIGSGSASAVESDFIYTTGGSPTVSTIVDYIGPSGDIYVPARLGGFPVVIGDTAFFANTNITSLVIEEGVLSIGAYAFYASSVLTSVSIPSTVTSIGAYAFSQCASLTAMTVAGANANYASVSGVLYDHGIATLVQCPGAFSGAFAVPGTVTAIGPSAFESCTRVTSIGIPASVTFIGDHAFSQCTSLTAITVAGANPSFTSSSGVLYDHASATLLKFPAGKAGAFTVPGTVTAIGPSAFEFASLLTSVSMSNGVTSIGPNAFAVCTRLASVSLGSGVTSIGDYAFYQCTALGTMIIPNHVLSIGANAFDTCNSLTTVTMGSGVAMIGSMAFFDCSSLTVIKFLGLSQPTVANVDWISGTPISIRGRALVASNFPAPWAIDGDPTFYDLKMGAYLTAPASPNALAAVPSNGQAVLSWNPPANDGGSAITGYNVYRSTSQSGTYALIASPTGRSYTDVGLINGQQYWYFATARNVFGEGAASTSISAIPFTVPNAPTGLTAIPGNGQVILNWTAPLFNGGNAIDYYIIYQDGSALPSHPTGITTTINGLNNGQSYSFTVAAHNLAGPSPQSSPVLAKPLTWPGPPVSLVAVPQNAQVRLNWTAPVFNGGASIDYYIIYQDGADIGHMTGDSAMIRRLSNGVSYSFTIAAHNAAGLGPQSSAALATPRTTPDVPTITSAAPGNGQVVLGWAAPPFDGGSPIDYYIVYQDGVDIGHPVASPLTATGLSNGVAYTFTIVAHNAAGLGLPSSAVTVTPFTRPDSPVLISLIPGLNSLTLSWRAPVFDGGSAITNYRLYWDMVDPPAAHQVTYGPSVFSIELTGLTAGTTYYLTATALNAAGESVPPTALSGVPMALPGPPRLVSAVEGLAQVALTWTAPADTGFGTIDVYRVYMGTSPGSLLPYVIILDGRLSFNVSELTPGTLYYFAVKAHNLAGDSVLSNVLSATPYTVPGAPTLTAAEAGNVSVMLTWTAPAYDGGRPLTGYKVYYSSGGPEVLFDTVGAGTRTVLVTHLLPGAEHLFWVKAMNMAGDSPISNILAATPYTTPGAPTLDSASAGREQVALIWTAPTDDGGAPLDGYKVFYGTTAPTQQFGDQLSSTVRTINVTGLTAGVLYHFAVRAVNVAGNGILSNEMTATPYTIPGAPVLNFATAGDSQVTLSWSAPSSTGFSPLLGYRLYYGTSTPDIPFGGLFPTSVTAANVTGLTPGVLYRFAVKAVNAAGDSLLSNVLSAAPYTRSDPPALISAEGGVLHVALHWSEPTYTGASSITGYKVFFGTVSPSEQFGGLLAPSARSVNVTGMQVGVTYYFAVKAVNAAGDSSLSNVMSAVPYTVPSAPVLTSASASIGRVSLNWTAPSSSGGSLLIGYLVYYGTTGPDFPLELVPADVLGLVLSGLSNGTSYQFAVKAVNAAGEGPFSNVLSAMPYTVPSAPTLVSATGGLNSAMVSWTAPGNDGGSPLLAYKVYFGLAEPNTQFGAALPADTLTVRVTELGAGSRYYFAIRAVNAAGDSMASNVLNATVMAVPGAPTDLKATPNAGKIILSWQAPTYSGGSAITSYLVYRALGGNSTLLASVGGATLNCTDTTAIAGTTYTYYVMASNSIGVGSSSVPVSASVPNPPADNTLLYVGIAIAALAVIGIVAMLMRRKK